MNTPNTYDIGDAIELKGTFTDPDSGDPVSPAEVTFRVALSGQDTPIDVETIDGGEGVYTAIFEPTQPGYYTFLCLGTGGIQAAAEQRFFVRQPRVPRPA